MPDAHIEVLTHRELDVLHLLARGLTSKEIANALVLSVRTVEHHRANLTAKLGARGRAELLRCAARLGWLSTRDSGEAAGLFA